MRLFFGVFATIIVLTGATLTVLALWGIQPISWTIVWKSCFTIFIICMATLLVSLFYYLFIKGYTQNKKR